MEKYYFVFYKWKHYGWNSTGQSTGVSEHESQAIIDKHPLTWQNKLNDKYGHEQPDTIEGHKFKEDFMVINWVELTKEEFNEFVGTV